MKKSILLTVLISGWCYGQPNTNCYNSNLTVNCAPSQYCFPDYGCQPSTSCGSNNGCTINKDDRAAMCNQGRTITWRGNWTCSFHGKSDNPNLPDIWNPSILYCNNQNETCNIICHSQWSGSFSHDSGVLKSSSSTCQ